MDAGAVMISLALSSWLAGLEWCTVMVHLPFVYLGIISVFVCVCTLCLVSCFVLWCLFAVLVCLLVLGVWWGPGAGRYLLDDANGEFR